MIASEIKETVAAKYKILQKEFDERGRRIWAATEANFLGHGGVKTVSQATGLAESTIRMGKREIRADSGNHALRTSRTIRRKGGGRKALTETNSSILEAVEALVNPTSRGDPMSPLRWTCKSTRKLAKELSRSAYSVSHTKVGQLLADLGYSLQSVRKRMEGKSHPDPDSQFEFINSQVVDFQRRNQPVISVDAKKKELIGAFANRGREFQPKGRPEEVETYDFPSLADGKGIPYGVYDMTRNQGWVSVGTDHDTAQFAVHSIGEWWSQMGRDLYPDSDELLITADGGGSNGSRNRLWKLELQKFVDANQLSVRICHFPPGTSKGNKIEHRMFSYITKNWRGRPLTSHEVVVNLIASTTTRAGLKIQARLDTKEYPTGIKVSDDEMHKVKLEKDDFHAELNYVIKSTKNQ